MAATDRAPLAIAALVLVVLADLVLSLRHRDRLGLPERECVDRSGGPASAGGAVAIARALRVAGHGDLDGTAVALPFEGRLGLAHCVSPFRDRVHGGSATVKLQLPVDVELLALEHEDVTVCASHRCIAVVG